MFARKMNLIAHDLVIVAPMSAMSGYINYIEYSTSVDKGQSHDRFISSPFGYGNVDANYTSDKVVDEGTLNAATTLAFDWNPVVAGTVDVTVGTDRYVDDGNGKIYLVPTGTKITKRLVTDVVDDNGVASGVPAHVEITFGPEATEAGTVVYAGDTAAITFTNAVTGAYVLKYSYNNIVVPQNKLPMIKAEMKSMPLLAKARRIAIYYLNRVA